MNSNLFKKLCWSNSNFECSNNNFHMGAYQLCLACNNFECGNNNFHMGAYKLCLACNNFFPGDAPISVSKVQR